MRGAAEAAEIDETGEAAERELPGADTHQHQVRRAQDRRHRAGGRRQAARSRDDEPAPEGDGAGRPVQQAHGARAGRDADRTGGAGWRRAHLHLPQPGAGEPRVRHPEGHHRGAGPRQPHAGEAPQEDSRRLGGAAREVRIRAATLRKEHAAGPQGLRLFSCLGKSVPEKAPNFAKSFLPNRIEIQSQT